MAVSILLKKSFVFKPYFSKIKDKGSLNNKLAILSVEAPDWQGAKVQEYQAYSELSQRSQAGCIGA